MKVKLGDPKVIELINIDIGKEVYTSARWRDNKKSKILYELRKLGYFKQLGRFRYVRC